MQQVPLTVPTGVSRDHLSLRLYLCRVPRGTTNRQQPLLPQPQCHLATTLLKLARRHSSRRASRTLLAPSVPSFNTEAILSAVHSKNEACPQRRSERAQCPEQTAGSDPTSHSQDPPHPTSVIFRASQRHFHVIMVPLPSEAPRHG